MVVAGAAVTLGILTGLVVSAALFFLVYWLRGKKNQTLSKAAATLAVAVVAKSDKDAEKAVVDAGSTSLGDYLRGVDPGPR